LLAGIGLLISGPPWNSWIHPSNAFAQEKPFRLPFDTPPGLDTWLLTQAYGNTAFAYRNRTSVYGAGQGIHFGLDFAARCGTPVVAVGDGVVSEVDNFSHGAGPHNLTIDHPNQIASFYGHLLETPDIQVGQEVKAGEFVAKTGDPDGTCTGRPHLHLELRDAPSHRTAINPVTMIDADWDRIALAGAFPLAFQQDFADPRRWQSLYDQPETLFGGPLLNDFDSSWPPNW
jgi:murein DD-endopeptidase MepM/ murein hydrolase activator NlpD